MWRNQKDKESLSFAITLFARLLPIIFHICDRNIVVFAVAGFMSFYSLYTRRIVIFIGVRNAVIHWKIVDHIMENDMCIELLMCL